MISEELKRKLNKFIQKYYLNKLTKGTMYTVGLGLVYTLVVSLAEYYGRFSGSVRLSLLIALIIGIGAITINYILLPLFGLMRLGKHLSYREAAKLVGKHFPEVDDRVLNTIELGEMSRETNSLVAASIEQKLQGFKAIPFNRAINLKENIRYWPVLVIPVLIFATLAITGQFKVVAEGSKRIVEYNKEFKEVAPFSFILLNESLSGEEGESYTVRLGFEGESIPASAEFVATNTRGRFVKSGNSEFEFNINKLNESVSFYIEANGFRSEVFDLSVVPVPKIRSLILRVDPPQYTGIKSFVAPSKTVLDIPEGSKVSWDANTKSTNGLSIHTGDTVYNLQGDEEGNFSYEMPVLESFDYKLVSVNKQISKESVETKQVNVIKDAFPDVESYMALDSTYSNTVFYRGQIIDDYGFTRLKLMAELGGKEVVLRRISFPNQSTQYSFSGIIRLDSLVGKEESAKLYLKVWDNDGVNGAKASNSKSMEVRLKTKEQQKEDIEKQYEEYFSGKEELSDRSEEIKKEMERLRNKLQNQKKSNWKDKERLREMLEEQKKILEEQKKLEEKSEELRKKEDELKPKSEDIKEKEKKIDELKDDPKQEELEKLLDEIAKLMDKIDMDKLTQKMEEMERLSEQNQRREERIDKLLEDLEFQKDVLEQTEKLQELAEKMDELSKEEKPSEEELKEQEEVKEEFEKVKEEVEKLKEKNEEFKEQTEEQNMEENEEKADESMEESKESLEKQDQKKANQQQKESSEQMEQMSQKMMQSMMQMQSDQNQENMETLRQILENLEILSFDIEDLSALSKESNAADPMFKRLLVDQKKLQDGAKIIEDSLVALGERVPEIKEIVYDELEDIEIYLDRSIQALEERMGAQSASHQQYVMTAANNLALLLDEALRNMQQQMASMMKGNQSCQKPGSGKPSMSNMKKMQSELGKQMQKMKDGQKQGKGEKKGSKGDSKELVEMLSRQEQLRRQLEEYAEQEGEQGDKGNLAKAIEEMKEVEKELLQGEIKLESIERVKEIETRLLESEKATLEQQEDEKRESKSAEEKEQLYQEELEKYLKEKENEVDNLYFAPLNMNRYYKSQSNNYINRL